MALVGFVVANTARARDTAECAAAYEEAQVLRQDRRLQEAHARLVMCTDASCPSAVVRDCLTWLGDVEKAIPTVVLAAQDEHGIDLVEVKIVLDGQPLSADMTGKALNLDPGAHTVRAELEGYETSEQGLVAREGEKSRVITFVMKRIGGEPEADDGSSGLMSKAGDDANSRKDEVKSPYGWSFYTLGAVAIVAGATGAVLGVSGKKDVDTLHDNCGATMNCDPKEVELARSKLIGANVAFGVAGAAAIGTAVVWWLGKRKASTASANLPAHASMGWVPGGGMAVVTGSY